MPDRSGEGRREGGRAGAPEFSANIAYLRLAIAARNTRTAVWPIVRPSLPTFSVSPRKKIHCNLWPEDLGRVSVCPSEILRM